MLTTIPAHSLGNTTFFLHTFIINLHSPFFIILTHLYSYFVIHFYPLKTVDQTVESLYFLNIFSQRSFAKIIIHYCGGLVRKSRALSLYEACKQSNAYFEGMNTVQLQIALHVIKPALICGSRIGRLLESSDLLVLG